jgi:hypothetical protein
LDKFGVENLFLIRGMLILGHLHLKEKRVGRIRDSLTSLKIVGPNTLQATSANLKEFECFQIFAV